MPHPPERSEAESKDLLLDSAREMGGRPTHYSRAGSIKPGDRELIAPKGRTDNSPAWTLPLSVVEGEGGTLGTRSCQCVRAPQAATKTNRRVPQVCGVDVPGIWGPGKGTSLPHPPALALVHPSAHKFHPPRSSSVYFSAYPPPPSSCQQWPFGVVSELPIRRLTRATLNVGRASSPPKTSNFAGQFIPIQLTGYGEGSR